MSCERAFKFLKSCVFREISIFFSGFLHPHLFKKLEGKAKLRKCRGNKVLIKRRK